MKSMLTPPHMWARGCLLGLFLFPLPWFVLVIIAKEVNPLKHNLYCLNRHSF